MEDKIKQLREEIVLGSLFTDDYKNSFGIDPHIVQDFFDGYSGYLWWLIEEDHPDSGDMSLNDNEGFQLFTKYDDDANLWNYAQICEDPLIDILYSLED